MLYNNQRPFVKHLCSMKFHSHLNTNKIMKAMSKIALAIVLIMSMVSCQTNADVNKILSKTDTRKAIMDTIANNGDMSKEMMTAMMNSNNGKMMMGDGKMPMMMMENHDAMMKMMKDNPAMMHSMMMNMMEACKNDTAMMSVMCKKMMEDPQMMNMMQKMKGGNMNMGKMNAMDTTKAVEHKAHH